MLKPAATLLPERHASIKRLREPAPNLHGPAKFFHHRRWLGTGRQKNGKRCPAFAYFCIAFHANRTPVLFDDALAHPQSKPGADLFLGGKKWLKKLAAVLGGNAVTGICHRDSQAIFAVTGR